MGRRWDPQPFHIDEEAAKSSIFGGLVAASAHLFAVSSWMATRMPYRTAALAALGSAGGLGWDLPLTIYQSAKL